MPPIAGRVNWIRQLYQHITEPVSTFLMFEQLMSTPKAKKAIKAYNKLARVFVEYEMLYHQGWSDEVISN